MSKDVTRPHPPSKFLRSGTTGTDCIFLLHIDALELNLPATLREHDHYMNVKTTGP